MDSLSNQLRSIVPSAVSLTILFAVPVSLRAAPIAWDAPIANATADNIDFTGSLIEAINFTTQAQIDANPSGWTVTSGANSVTFTGATNTSPRITGATGIGYSGTAPGYHNVTTGNTPLDEVFIRSHAFTSADGPGAIVTVNLSGLSAGTPYQVQILAVGDNRSCCLNRQFQADDSAVAAAPGNLSDIMQRDQKHMIIGRFTADADTQNFSIRGFQDATVGGDPGIAGYILRTSVVLVPGDTDGDGIGGEFPDDFEPIRANFRKSVSGRSMGDLVTNGVVDFDDFHQWKTAFVGAGGSLAGLDISFANVPEPTAAALALVALLGIIGSRRRR